MVITIIFCSLNIFSFFLLKGTQTSTILLLAIRLKSSLNRDTHRCSIFCFAFVFLILVLNFFFLKLLQKQFLFSSDKLQQIQKAIIHHWMAHSFSCKTLYVITTCLHTFLPAMNESLYARFIKISTNQTRQKENLFLVARQAEATHDFEDDAIIRAVKEWIKSDVSDFYERTMQTLVLCHQNCTETGGN